MKQAISYRKHRQYGDSLLEVMLALGLVGMAVFSLIGLQFAALRVQQATLRYAKAVQLVDAAAEALRAGYSVARVQAEWQAQTAHWLPAGVLRIINQEESVYLITLYWQEAKQNTYELGRAQATCPSVAVAQGIQCVSIAVVR